jgi:hypothetical protein
LVYPFPFLSNADEQMNQVVQSLFSKYQLDRTATMSFPVSLSPSSLETQSNASQFEKIIKLSVGATKVPVRLLSGQESPGNVPYFVETPYHQTVLALMVIAHSAGDFCLIGEKVCLYYSFDREAGKACY